MHKTKNARRRLTPETEALESQPCLLKGQTDNDLISPTGIWSHSSENKSRFFFFFFFFDFFGTARRPNRKFHMSSIFLPMMSFLYLSVGHHGHLCSDQCRSVMVPQTHPRGRKRLITMVHGQQTDREHSATGCASTVGHPKFNGHNTTASAWPRRKTYRNTRAHTHGI